VTDAAVQIPPSIVAAILHVKAKVEPVKKSQRNGHGGYQFASTDDIYAATTRLMAEAGLVIMPLEAAPPEIVKNEKDGKTSQWGKFTFSFVLATKDATWSDPCLRRTLFIQITGPQTFQAAESYAVKTLLRSLFKLPTGDMDLDSVAQAETIEAQEALNGKPKRKSSAEGKRDGSVAEFNKLVAAIAAASNREDLQALYMDCADTNGPWAGMPTKWAGLLQDDYDSKMEGFAARAAAE